MAIVHTEHRDIQRGGVAGEQAFTIKASAKAFSILSNALYSNKPLAIVRELCTNAYDSHVAAGKADTPIELILPTRLNGGQLIVKDFGTGLDHDQMIAIYTKFFESTKTESNDFVGQLGLGSKSPFSMFKTFSVEARKDNVKRIYTAFLNEEGIPTIALMSEANTDEGNGVSVSMHVKPDDFDKFYQAARAALMYFDPKPIVSGTHNFQTFSVKHGIGGTNWKIRETEYWARMTGPHVVQGFVVYPIDAELIKQAGNLSAAAYMIASQTIDYWMPIGSVDVAPSREALSYDKRTIANIAAAFETAANELRTAAQDEINKATTLWDAAIKLHHYLNEGTYELRNMFAAIHGAKAFTWNGKPIPDDFILTNADLKTIQFARYSRIGAKRVKIDYRMDETNTDSERYIKARKSNFVLINDVKRGTSDIISQFISANSANYVYVLSPVSKKDGYNQREMNKIIKLLGNPVVQKLSDLPFTASAVQRAAGRSKEQRRRFIGFRDSRRYGGKNRTFSHRTWETVDVDLAKGGFYLPMERYNVVHNGIQHHLDEVIHASIELGLISEDDATTRLFGFTAKEIEKAGPNWKNFFVYVAEQFDAKNMAQRLIDEAAAQHVESMMSEFNRHIGAQWAKYEHMLVNGKFKTFINKVRKMKTTNANKSTINSFLRYVNTKIDVQSQSNIIANQLHREWDQLIAEHGMLTMIHWWHVDANNAPHLIAYINAMNIR